MVGKRRKDIDFLEHASDYDAVFLDELEAATADAKEVAEADVIAEPTQATSIADESVRGEHLDSLFVEWLSPAVHHHHVDHRWRIAVVGILLGMAALAIFWQGSFLTALTFIAMAVVASFHFHREPKHIAVRIHPQGVTVNNRTIPYHDIESFWIHYIPGHFKELSLHCRNHLHPRIKIPLTDQDPSLIRAKLARYVVEEPHEETFLDMLGRKLGI